MRLSCRVESLKPSATIAVANRAKQLRSEGVDVLSFAAGEPDFDTPDCIKQAAIRALESGLTGYAPTPGDPDTRKAVAAKLSRENGIPDVSPEHVVITAGGKHALYLLFQALLDPAAPDGDAPEVLLPTPAWVSYAPQAELAGGRVVEIAASAAAGFKISPEQLRSAISPRSRILIFNSPSNPTGAAYSESEVRALASVVGEAARSIAPDLVVITDEIYEKLVYRGFRHFSFGALAGVAERTITVNGMSKAFAMTGWRLGYCAGSGEFGRRIAGAVGKLQGQTTTAVTSFCLPAMRAALVEAADDVERMRASFEERSGIIHAALRSMPGVDCPRPDGAFYVFPDVSAHFGKRSAGGRPIGSALEFAGALLDEQRVACVPGEDFLGCGSDCVRLSFACSSEQVRAGMERIGEFVSGLR